MGDEWVAVRSDDLYDVSGASPTTVSCTDSSLLSAKNRAMPARVATGLTWTSG